MRRIAEGQIAAEDAAARTANRWLFCDTSPLTTLFYSRELFGRAEPELEALAERPYDLTVLCAPDFPFVQDGTRRDERFRTRQHDWYRRALARAKSPGMVVHGGVADRVAQVTAQLRGRV